MFASKIFGKLPLFLCALFSANSLAGSLEVTPVRLVVDAKTPVAAITLRNTGAEAMVVQAELMQWSGHETYVPSRELLVNPLIFKLEPGAAQIVRIGLNSKRAQTDKELAYRLYFQEVPQQAFPTRASGLRIALRLGIPVFVPPAHPAPDLIWKVERMRDGEFWVELKNAGNNHVQVLDLALASTESRDAPAASKKVQEYVLAGERSHWIVHPEPALDGNALNLSVHTDGETIQKTIVMNR